MQLPRKLTRQDHLDELLLKDLEKGKSWSQAKILASEVKMEWFLESPMFQLVDEDIIIIIICRMKQGIDKKSIKFWKYLWNFCPYGTNRITITMAREVKLREK